MGSKQLGGGRLAVCFSKSFGSTSSEFVLEDASFVHHVLQGIREIHVEFQVFLTALRFGDVRVELKIHP